MKPPTVPRFLDREPIAAPNPKLPPIVEAGNACRMRSPIAAQATDASESQARAAAWLADAGVGWGERVAVVAPSSLDYLAVALGALRSGIIPVLVNTSLLTHERAYILDDSQPSLVLGEREVASAAHHPRRAELAPWPLGRPMAYTSGTTGRPKGVYSGVLSEADAEALWTEEMELWALCPTDSYVQIGPLYHSAPLRFAACTLLAGGSVVVPGPFDARLAAAAIAEHRPTVTFAAPIHLQRLFAVDPKRAWRHMRLVAYAGAPCPPEVAHEARSRFGPDSVREFYGSTEGQFTVCTPEDRRAAPTSVGRARPNRRLSIDADGHIWCAAPAYAAFTYWGDAERSAQAWRTAADGSAEFTVGDLGRLERGYLYLDGRRDDLIISGGVNVYPAEVERALADVPGVETVVAFGAPDDDWGQAVTVVAVPSTPGESPSALQSRLAERAAAALAPYKRPKRVLLRTTLPVSSTGKVRRGTLAADLGL
ncbi:MAG: class I adenylate-forming enzyme family protein [Microthrixaceae bacterium]